MPIVIKADAGSIDGEQNPCPGRIITGVPEVTLGSYFPSSAAWIEAAANATDTLLNLSTADDFPLPEPLTGNGATSCFPGDAKPLILYWCV